MHSISEVRILPFSTKELFDLVMDVESYPQFLSFCSNAKITSKTENKLTADLTISFAGMNSNYSSLIEYNFSEEFAQIIVTSPSSAFKHLHNIWKFTNINQSTKVELFLEFELKSTLLNSMLNLVLSKMHREILESFEKQAIKRYKTS